MFVGPMVASNSFLSVVKNPPIDSLCSKYGFLYQNSIIKRNFYIYKEAEEKRFPFIKIISPVKKIISANGKILVDFVIGDLTDLKNCSLSYFINNKRIKLLGFEPFLLQNIPPSRVVLKLVLYDKNGKKIVSDKKEIIFK